MLLLKRCVNPEMNQSTPAAAHVTNISKTRYKTSARSVGISDLRALTSTISDNQHVVAP